jgi:glycosyltransferase involved in cell wall biosynthesis
MKKEAIVDFDYSKSILSKIERDTLEERIALIPQNTLPEILIITPFPPKECGIATYSQDLVKSLNKKFSKSFKLNICALESDYENHRYDQDVTHILNSNDPYSYIKLAQSINDNSNLDMVMIQHEFGLFQQKEDEFQYFLNAINKIVIIGFHTVLANPDEILKVNVKNIAKIAEYIVVMTNYSAQILMRDYGIENKKIIVIPHGTHLVRHSEKTLLKSKYNLKDKYILSTFGLLGSGKSIETTLKALPKIIAKNPTVLFLIIGKTHPSIVKNEGEKYRLYLEQIIAELKIKNHVQFINQFLPLPELLEYLQLTDIYLFTSKDPNQAVSGTFAYAISCGCPIISTPIPHAQEVLTRKAGIIIDFGDSKQLGLEVNKLLKDESLRKAISSHGLHEMASTAWENSAIAHALLFEKISPKRVVLNYSLPDINLDHIKKMTTNFGIIQFSKINTPDLDSGYTLDDNARAMIAMCQYYELTKDESAIKYILIYFNFIKFCFQTEGYYLNYVDEQHKFTEQNNSTNLADSNGRAIWALGFLVSIKNTLPPKYVFIAHEAEKTIEHSILNISKIHSTRAMAFIIKGLYYRNKVEDTSLIKQLADRLVQMYKHEGDNTWTWFESYLTYANSILPEAMLCAWLSTGIDLYKEIAKKSFDFLLSKTFKENSIKVISNKGWLYKTNESNAKQENLVGGEQPIDVAYTILALSKFHDVFKEEEYLRIMKTSLDWFLGTNHLHQIIYNPCTGGCYDGLEESSVNLNQGAESTVSYLMARLAVEKSVQKETLETLMKNKLVIQPREVLI